MSAADGHRFAREDLVALFTPTLGREKSIESVDAAALMVRAGLGGWTLDQALAIVTEMGKTKGLVGIVSRLAIARLQAGQAYRSAGGVRTTLA